MSNSASNGPHRWSKHHAVTHTHGGLSLGLRERIPKHEIQPQGTQKSAQDFLVVSLYCSFLFTCFTPLWVYRSCPALCLTSRENVWNIFRSTHLPFACEEGSRRSSEPDTFTIAGNIFVTFRRGVAPRESLLTHCESAHRDFSSCSHTRRFSGNFTRGQEKFQKNDRSNICGHLRSHIRPLG